MSTGGPVRRCVFVPVHTSRETTDDTATSTPGQRHDRSRPRREHEAFLSHRRHRARASLPAQSRPDLCPGGPGLPHLSSRTTGVELEELQLRTPRRAVPVSHHSRGARPALLCARRQGTLHVAPDSQSRRTGAPVHRHHQPQASRLADDGLCRRASGERTRSIAAHRYRLRPDVSARRPGQGQQGPLRRGVRSRPGCSSNCASTGVASVPSAGCSPVSSSPGR